MFVVSSVHRIARRIAGLIAERRADEFGEKAVVIVFVVLLGIAAFQAFGSSVAGLISDAAGAI
ncbi:MAG: hypothetical protein QY332_10290 [Anaerolineales bacterium]|nr:MAG: hypothetical protein QY332_10290 [Anaerolineales bacterium]